MFKPSEFAVGGGLLDDVDVKVTQARIVMFDYNGTQQKQPAVELTLDHGDAEPAIQDWTVGKATDWQPSEDGTQLIAIGRATQINASSNAAILLKSLVDAGFPEDKITDAITFLEGLEGHVMRVPAPVRKGLTGQKEGQTILTFASITKMPWDSGKKAAGKAAPKAGAKATTQKAPAPAAEETSGEEVTIESQTADILLEILAGCGDAGIAKSALPGAIMKAAAALDTTARKAIVQLAFKDDFLKSGPWTYEGGKLKL
jgi:hypothetical protein